MPNKVVGFAFPRTIEDCGRAIFQIVGSAAAVCFYVGIAAAIVGPIAAADSYAAMHIWTWYVATRMGIRDFPFSVWFGMVLVFSILNFKFDNSGSPSETSLAERYFTRLLVPFASLAIAWILLFVV